MIDEERVLYLMETLGRRIIELEAALLFESGRSQSFKKRIHDLEKQMSAMRKEMREK